MQQYHTRVQNVGGKNKSMPVETKRSAGQSSRVAEGGEPLSPTLLLDLSAQQVATGLDEGAAVFVVENQLDVLGADEESRAAKLAHALCPVC